MSNVQINSESLDDLKQKMKVVKRRIADDEGIYVKLWLKALELGATLKELELDDSQFVVKGSMPEFASLGIKKTLSRSLIRNALREKSKGDHPVKLKLEKGKLYQVLFRGTWIIAEYTGESSLFQADQACWKYLWGGSFMLLKNKMQVRDISTETQAEIEELQTGIAGVKEALRQKQERLFHLCGR